MPLTQLTQKGRAYVWYVYYEESLVCEETHDSVKLGKLKPNSVILEEIGESQKVDLGLVDRFLLINQGK